MWLPESIRRERTAMLRQMAETDATLKEWNRELRRIDPGLSLIRAKPNSQTPELRPGFYHLLRINARGEATVIVHEGSNGEYREPDAGLFDTLREMDCWNDTVRHERARRQRLAREAQERAEERERQARLEHMMLHLKALDNPGVLVSDVPWTAKAGVRA